MELSTTEGFRLLEQIRSFGNPLMVLTGGDPLKRPDLLPLLRHSVTLGLRTQPDASITNEAIQSFQDAGVARMAISLDGATAESHDRFRGRSRHLRLRASRAAVRAKHRSRYAGR